MRRGDRLPSRAPSSSSSSPAVERRISCANDRPYRELVEVREAGGATVARSAAGGAVGLIAGRLPGREHPLVASLRAQLGRFRGRRPRRRGRAAGDRRRRRRGDGAHRRRARAGRGAPRRVICVLQFDSASAAVLGRLLARRQAAESGGLERAGRRLELETPAVDFAAGAFYSLYSGVELGDHGHLLSVPVVARPAAGALRDRVRGPAGGLGAPRESRACAHWRSIPTRAARRGEPTGCSSAAGGSPTGWCCRAGRGPRALRGSSSGAWAAARRRPRSSAARGSATCSRLRDRLVAAPARIAGARRGAARARELRSRVAHVQRRSSRRASVLGPLAARRASPRPGDAGDARGRARRRLRRRRRRDRPGARGAAARAPT